MGIRNWGRQRCLRPYGGICVLQAADELVYRYVQYSSNSDSLVCVALLLNPQFDETMTDKQTPV